LLTELASSSSSSSSRQSDELASTSRKRTLGALLGF
jgi:hypothetical protein